jgi:hypothetical protein
MIMSFNDATNDSVNTVPVHAIDIQEEERYIPPLLGITLR